MSGDKKEMENVSEIRREMENWTNHRNHSCRREILFVSSFGSLAVSVSLGRICLRHQC